MRRIVLSVCVLISVSLYGVERPDAKPRSNYLQPYIVSVENSQSPESEVTTQLRSRPRIRFETSVTCYTMHTFVAATKTQSDETEIVKQSTCTPSSQFETKHTDLKTK